MRRSIGAALALSAVMVAMVESGLYVDSYAGAAPYLVAVIAVSWAYSRIDVYRGARARPAEEGQ